MNLVKTNEATLSKSTVFVRNLPYDITEAQFEQLFDDVGPIRSSFLVRGKGTKDKCRGFGYVTFTLKEDAERAIILKRSINGRHIQVLLANRKVNIGRKRSHSHDSFTETSDNNNLEIPSAKKFKTSINESDVNDDEHTKKVVSPITSYANSGRTIFIQNLPNGITRKQLYKRLRKKADIEELKYPLSDSENCALVLCSSYKKCRYALDNLQNRNLKGSRLNVQILSKINKKPSKKSINKARIIVRNLCFDCHEKDLLPVFSRFGNVISVSLPPKGADNSKLAGFAFVQFENVFQAASAIKELNMTEIMNRQVSVDWALPKSLYLKNLADNSCGKNENEAKFNDPDSDSTNDEEITNIKDDNKEAMKDVTERKENRNQSKFKDDIHEGKTLFIRNLSFDSNEEEIKNFFSKFGKIRYCKIVIDPTNDYSRGMAFIKYFERRSADECLKAYNDNAYDFSIQDRKLIICRAVSRTDASNLSAAATKPPKDQDKRNLYLAQEGVITPGSAAAEGLSKADVKKRVLAETEKRAKLKDPNYLISKTRLCIRNIPVQVSDKDLKKSIASFVDGKEPVKIKKIKIMRDRNRINNLGIAKSRGFGFVEFFNHNDALKTLRTINNNPLIFGSEKRLIVEFAIENQRALHRKQLRQERSKLNLRVRTNQYMTTSTTGSKIHDDSDNVDVNGKVHVEKRMKTARNQAKIATKINSKKLKFRKSYTAEDNIPPSTDIITSNRHDSIEVASTATDIDSSSRPKYSQKIKGHNCPRKVRNKKLLRHKIENQEENSLNDLIKKYKAKLETASVSQSHSKWLER